MGICDGGCCVPAASIESADLPLSSFALSSEAGSLATSTMSFLGSVACLTCSVDDLFDAIT